MTDPQNRQLDHQQFQRRFGELGRRFPLHLLAKDVDVPMNVGSLFRIADALGVEHLHLSGTSAQPPHPKLRKTSRATEKYVPYSYSADALGVARELGRSGYLLVSLELTSSSIDIRDLDWDGERKLCLILGSEKTGVDQALLDVSDHTVHIPMVGKNSSMNVATACAIAVFELTRSLHPGGPSAALTGPAAAG